MVDNLTVAQRSHTMSRIRSRDTVAELILRRALHSRGHRYRVNVASLPGKPDIVFSKVKLVIFVDGDFWHGWQFELWAHKLAPYWQGKISGNMARDKCRTEELLGTGWHTLRIWEHDIKNDIDGCIHRIEQCLSLLRREMDLSPAKQ